MVDPILAAEPADSYHLEHLAGVMNVLSEFDRSMNVVVEEAQLLKGASEGSLEECGRGIGMKDDVDRVVQWVVDNGVPLRVGRVEVLACK